MPRVVMLTAPWCQWCMVMHAEVVDRPEVRNEVRGRIQLAEVNVDQFPAWMDLRDVQGLPTLVFFDTAGQHVLSKSGFLERAEFVDLIKAVERGLEDGEIRPYAPHPISQMGAPITPDEAAAALTKFERALFFKVNSNDGGFGSPSRHPYPALLVELLEWSREFEAPERVREWTAKTVEHASRGESPLLLGNPLPNTRFTIEAMHTLSKAQQQAPGWRDAIESLPGEDPYLGLRDPIDHGYFRYAAGPGWVHPHFERLAADNLAWIALLEMRGLPTTATREYVERTFRRQDGWLNRAQASDPFYYRLPAETRSTLSPPPVDDCPALEVQAWNARNDPDRCPRFIDALPTDEWPTALITGGPAAATADAVGEALLTAGACDEADVASLADLSAEAWRRGLPATARLHRLAAGLCAVRHASCAAALRAASEIPIDPRYPPPMVAMARMSKR